MATTVDTRRPTPQGVDHPTFKAAPFDHGLSVPRLYEYHAEHSPNHPAFAYADPATNEVHDVTFADTWKRICTISDIVFERYESSPTKAEDGTPPIIGVLALADALSYIQLKVAIMGLGYIVLPLSPRNSPTVIAHLLEKTGARQLYVSADDAMQNLSRASMEILAQKGIKVDVVPMITTEDWSKPTKGTGRAAMKDIADTDVTIIMHSSGTTAFPKCIPVTRRGLVNLSNIPCFGEVDLAGKRIAAHTNPICHAMGLASLMWPLTSGATFSFYAPVLPQPVPSPANFLAAWTACKCDIVFCIPIFIEAWARDPANLPLLKSLDCIVFSGAPMSKPIGDMLAKSGVTLHPFWGSTEVGPATMFIPRDPPPVDEWEYFKFSHHITFHLEPREGLENIYEPIMIPTERCFPAVTNSEIDGKPVFAVGDLLERHPTDPERFRVFGRKDDQIVLSSALNVNPIPIEGMLVQDPNIASAIVFGQQRIQLGVLIEPPPHITIPTGDAQKLEEFKDLIWPTIEKVNEISTLYSRIERNLILVTSPEKPLEHTPKGTPRRGVCMKLYADEIDQLYAKHEEGEDVQQRVIVDRV
ncbi:acetyl-CoA synthetase-like protein [Cubamyces sp. BRFM 1775]|nr:acetyl-CoA synthetase-like protein [Cubamyces sp. BRFM 1775]